MNNVGILIGEQPCDVTEVTPELVMCITRPFSMDKEAPVEIWVDGQMGICTGNCNVLFSQDNTDVVERIVRDPEDDQRLQIYGRFKDGLEKVKVGDFMCEIEKKKPD